MKNTQTEDNQLVNDGLLTSKFLIFLSDCTSNKVQKNILNEAAIIVMSAIENRDCQHKKTKNKPAKKKAKK